jgi:protein TonB
LSEGIYLNNEKTGIWEYYDFKGEIEVRYNYSTNELLFNKKNEFLDTDKEYKVFVNNDTLRTILDREPVFIGSMFNELFKNIKYPALARENGKSGKVIVSFVIDKNGKTKNHTIIHGMGYGCDEEALRVIKEYLTFWSPALYQEKPVDIEYILPVTFKLQ